MWQIQEINILDNNLMQTISPLEKQDYDTTMGNLILGKEIHSCLFLAQQNCSLIKWSIHGK